MMFFIIQLFFQAIEEALEAASSDLRKKLSESFYATDVPHLKFIGDRRHLYEEVLNEFPFKRERSNFFRLHDTFYNINLM